MLRSTAEVGIVAATLLALVLAIVLPPAWLGLPLGLALLTLLGAIGLLLRGRRRIRAWPVVLCPDCHQRNRAGARACRFCGHNVT